MNQLQSTGSGHLPSQTISNPKGNQPKLVSNDFEANFLGQQQTKAISLPFPTRTIQARKFKLDEELLQTFKKISKYAKFLKELCTHKRNKLKGDIEMGRNVFALIKSKQVSTLT
ncbi:hypothetical protein CR513_10394, partial [Mucuna pruriens]